MPIDTEQWRASIGLFCASRVLLQPPRCKQPQPKVQADTLPLNMRITLAVLLVTLRTAIFYACRILQLLWLITCHASWLLSSIVKGSRRRLRGVSVLLALCLVVVPMLLIMSGDVEENPGPPKMQTTYLGMNDLCYVLDELLDVCHKWFNLGLMLQLNVGTLECVRNQYPDSSSALREMLLSWLKKVDPPPTWEGLACALESRTVGEPRLAEQLRTNHCSSRKRRREQPHCDIPGENWDIVDEFSVALKAIEDFLAVEPPELKAYLSRISHPLKPDEPYVRLCQYESAATTPEIIQNLFPKFINYQNTGLLRKIVQRFGCDKCKADLQEYLQHYSKFTDKKLCNMPNAVSGEELDQATGVKRLRVETNLTLGEATIANTAVVQNGVGQATGIDPCFIVPAQHDPGSLILTFLVPESVYEIFCELCEEDLEILANCRITRLQIEDCGIENIQKQCTNADREKELFLCFDDSDITAKGIDIALLLKKKVLQCTQYAHLVNLLAAIPREDMRRVCSNKFLQRVTHIFGNWNELAPYLGITGSTLQQIALQYHSVEEQSYQALLQWKELFQDSATHEGLVEFLVRHAPLPVVEAALNIISPAKLAQKARQVLQQAYLAPRNDCLWPVAPSVVELNQRLGRYLKSDLDSVSDYLPSDYSLHIKNFPAAFKNVSVKSFLNAVSQKQQRLFLLKGPHGSGKTVLLQRACSLWAQGLCWRKFSLVFRVDMMALAIALEPDSQYSFETFMQYVVPEGVDLRDFCDLVLINQGHNLLFVLDGVDSFTNKPFLDAILSEPLLRKGSVIATSSSPHQAFSLKWSEYYLLGLSEDQITRQVISYYCDSPRKAEDFFTFISAAPAINVLCSNPPCLAAVLSVFDNGYPGDLPATWTQLFQQLVLLFVRQCPTLDQSTTIQTILQQLAYCTYHGGVVPEPLSSFFSTVTPPYMISVKPAVTYGRLLLPWLTSSYLTAVYILTLPLEEQAALMESQSVGAYVWQFYAGLCSSENTLNHVLTNYCHQDIIKCATCLHEARNLNAYRMELTVERTLLTAYETHVVLSVAQSLCESCRVTIRAGLLGAGALTEIGKCLTAVSVLDTGGIGELRLMFERMVTRLSSQYDQSLSGKSGGYISLQDLQEVRALARGVAVNSTLKTLIFQHIGLSAEGTSALASALCINHSLKRLDLSLTRIPDAGVSALAGALRVNQSLEKLDLGLTNISAEGASALASALYVNHSLKQLNLRGTGLSDERASELANLLCGKHHLKVLNLSGNKMTDAGVFYLAGALRVNQSLEKLDLSNTDLSAEGVSALINAVFVNHCLKVLILSGNKIPDAGVSALVGALRVNQSIEKLDLSNTNLSAEGVSALVNAVFVNHSLKVLILSRNRIHDAGVFALAAALKVNQNIEKLDLGGSKIGDPGVSALVEALMVNRSLKELILGLTGLSTEGVSTLSRALCVNHRIKELSLSLTSISDVGASALAGALRVNQSLEKLHLELAGISAEGASALASALRFNHSLKDLNLSGTGLSDERASELAHLLCGRHHLKVLNLSGNKMTNAGVFFLAGALRVNQSLKKLDLELTGVSAEEAFALASALYINHSLKQLNLRGTGLSDERASELAHLLCGGHHLKVLNLSGNKMSDAGVFFLAGALSVNKSLEKLELSFSGITDEEVSALAGALRVNQSLEKLDLELTGISAEGGSALTSALYINHSLKQLNLRGTGLSDERASELARLLCGRHHLKVLNLSGNKMSDAGVFFLAGALSVNKSPEKLELSFSGITDEGVCALAGALRVNQSLEKLDLELTGISAEGASALASALYINHSLKQLNLRGTGLSEEKAFELADLLSGKHYLKVLNLCRNKMTDAGFFILAGALRVNQCLEKLDLKETYLLTDGVSALANALCENHSVKVLILGWNWMRDAGVFALAEAVRVNRSIEKLDLRYTGLSANGVSLLASALCVNHSLKELDLTGNNMTTAGVSALVEALRVNQSLKKLDLSGVCRNLPELKNLAEGKGIDITILNF